MCIRDRMYRALVGLIEMNGVVGELTNAMKFGMASAITIMCIALGVAIPNVFARRWVAKDRQRKLHQLIEERRKRGHFIDLAKL